MTLRHRVEKGPHLHQVVFDLVYDLTEPSAVPAEISHLGQVFIIESRASNRIDDRPLRNGEGHVPRVQRTLFLSGTRYCELACGTARGC